MAASSLSGDRTRAVVGSIVFLFLVPGTIGGFLPWVISRWQFREFPAGAALRMIGAAAVLAGAAVLLEAFGRFALEGRGTPAPVYPTERLIVRGTYRFVRNPMYLAVEGVILGQAALFGSFDLVIYAAMIAVGFYLFVVLAEEPVLKRSFPSDYRRYAANVRRWLPRLTPWRPGR